MTRPDVAIFASSFAPHLGGVEELTRHLAIEQRRAGTDAIVITNRYPKDLPPADTIDGIPVYRERFRFPEPRVRQLGGWLVGTAKTRRRIVRTLDRHRSSLVHVQCVSSNGYYALRAARRRQLPLVVTMQGELTMDATGIYERSALMRRTWRELLDRADAVTGCSQYVIDEAVAVYGDALQAKAEVIRNGVDVAAVRAADREQRDRPYILGIGRFVRQKGFDLLIDGFARVAEAWPDVQLVLAGDGPERQSLAAQAARTGLGDRIALVGGVPASRAFALFRGAHAFVLPSRHEPQGIVVLEAFAAGSPVVAASVGGVPETVRHADNGLLFTGGNVDALAGALTEVLGDRAAAERRAARAGEDVLAYDWPVIADLYQQAYERAVKMRD